MSATGDNNELISALAGNLKVAVSGFNVDPLIQDGETAEVYVDVDDPLTIEQILANVSAEDDVTPADQLAWDVEGSFIPSKVGNYDIKVIATYVA